MLLRTVVLTVAIAAPMGAITIDASAQDRGPTRAAVATATADAGSNWAKGAAKGRQLTLPPGIAKRSPDRPLPPGLRRTRGVTEPEPEPQAEPEPQPDGECVDGVLVINQLPSGPCTGTP
jgi:hypothetical protein